MNSKSNWIKFECTDEQIKEINSCESFKLLRKDGQESFILNPPFDIDEDLGMSAETIDCYMILEE